MVDLANGDYKSAVLDLVGVIPFVGEIADVAKTADKAADVVRVVNKTSDVAKIADKAIDTAKALDAAGDATRVAAFDEFPKNIHTGRQGEHSTPAQLFEIKEKNREENRLAYNQPDELSVSQITL